MAEKVIDGVGVNVSDDGYFTDPKQWTKEMAFEIANEEGITLTDKHFLIIDFLRQKQAAGESLSIRKVGLSGLVDIKEFYQLFPGGPLKISSKIAGIPKPVSCV